MHTIEDRSMPLAENTAYAGVGTQTRAVTLRGVSEVYQDAVPHSVRLTNSSTNHTVFHECHKSKFIIFIRFT